MDHVTHIDDWPAELLKAAVVDDTELTAEQAQALREFVRRIGGTENAVMAIEMLQKLEDAWVNE